MRINSCYLDVVIRLICVLQCKQTGLNPGSLNVTEAPNKSITWTPRWSHSGSVMSPALEFSNSLQCLPGYFSN